MDYRALVEPYRQRIIKDIISLIQIPSKKGPAFPAAPFGKANQQALAWMLAKAKQDGYQTTSYDGYAGRLEVPGDERIIGVLCHLDVVPEQAAGWQYPPYEGVVDNGVLYGRGANDDKGPAIAVYYALQALLEHGYVPKHTIHMIFGCDEEGNMECMDHYKTHCDHLPDAGFVPDCTFPMNYGEHGLYALRLHVPLPKEVLSIRGGEHPHIVCSSVHAVIAHQEDQESLFRFYMDTKEMTGELDQKNVDTIHITGSPAHGSRPFVGHNAADALFCFLGAAYHIEVFQTLYHKLSNWQGTPLGIQCRDMKYGELSLCVTQVETIHQELLITIDVRYPFHLDKTHLFHTMEHAFAEIKGSYLEIIEDREGHYTDPNSDMVKKLEEIYRQQSQDWTTPIKVSPGDTYARKFENFVAYGPTTSEHLRKKYIGQAHQCNEGMELDTLLQGCAIYAQALAYLLGGSFQTM